MTSTGHCTESFSINLRVYEFCAFWVSSLSSFFGSGALTLFRHWLCTLVVIFVVIFVVIIGVLSLASSVFARLAGLWCW